MTHIDYRARAALYLGSDWHTAAQQGARTFGTAAQAIRFAFEEAAPVSLRGARLEVGDASFTGEELAALYRSPAFPFPRKRDTKRSPARRPRSRRGPVSAPARPVAARAARVAEMA